MKNLRAEFIEQLKDFVEIANKYDIWYSMDDQSLLGSIRHAGFVPWEEKVQVMMTEESYVKLKRIANNRVVDSSDNREIKSLCGFFLKDAKNIKKQQGFVEIRVLSPTTTKKIKQFKSPMYAIKNLLKNRKINIRTALTDLHDVRFEGYLPLSGRNQKVKSSWIQAMSFDVEEKNFVGIKVNVIKEYKRVLEEWFGENYMDAIMPKSINNYMSPIEIIKEVL